VQFKIDGVNAGAPVALSANQATLTMNALTVSGSPHTIEADYLGGTNFNGSSGTLAGGQTVTKRDTTTSVMSSGSPSTFGQSVTFTATVAGTGGGAGDTGTDGTVQFKIDGANAGAPVALSANQATLTTNALTVAGSPHTIEADYLGGANFNGSSGTLAGGQTVTKRATTTSVASSANPSTFGQSVTFTATVGGTGTGAGDPGTDGTVQFKIDGVNAGAPVALSANQATLTTTALTVSGSPHTIEADYLGGTNFNGSSGTLASGQTVAKRDTTTSVASSANPSTFGQNVTLTATVAGTDSGAGDPGTDGSVQFKIDGVNAGAPVALSANQATLTTSALAVSGSPHTIEADYLGGNNFNGSSGTLASGQTVNRRATSATVASNVNPSKFGQSVTFTATVVGTGAGAGDPNTDGTVQFKIDGVNAGTPVALSANQATLTTSALMVSGSPHTIEAVYLGGNNFSATSGTLGGGQTVIKGDTSTAVTNAAPEPSLVGQSYTVSIAVSSVVPAAGVPGGTVTISDGAASCIAPLAAGSGSCSLTTTTVGTKTMTATYGGDGNFNGSVGAAPHNVDYNVCVLYDQYASHKKNSTVPIKLYLCNSAGTDISSPAIVVTATSLVLTSNAASPFVIDDSGNANPDNNFRYDVTLGPSGGYIFNLSTKSLTTGTFALSLVAAGDPVTHTVQFSVK
jgi:hypothetical protein